MNGDNSVWNTLTRALGWGDVAVVVAATAALLVIAAVAGRRQKDTRDYFIGERKIPAFVVCLSFVATEISAMTILIVPAAAFGENWNYLQLFIGSVAARIFIAFFFLPRFYKHNVTSIYEYLRIRFGPATQYAGSIFFFITRLLASGIRLYAACMGIAILLGASRTAGGAVDDTWLFWTMLFFVLVSAAFTALGGIRGVVWNGAYEAVFFYVTAVVLAVFLILHLRGSPGEIWHTAASAGRMEVFNFRLDITDAKTIWAVLLFSFFVDAAVYGTDQEFVQRLLTVKTRQASQRAMLGTILAGFPLVALYLCVGTLLFVFYQQNPAAALPGKTDEILPHFGTMLPMGLKGLLLAAIVLAGIHLPLNSLSSSFVMDIYKRLLVRQASERHYLWVSRGSVLVFGLLLGLIAWQFRSSKGILWIGFQILSVTGGATLGVFMLGVLTKRRGNRGNVVAMIASSLVMLTLLLLSHGKLSWPDWPWLRSTLDAMNDFSRTNAAGHWAATAIYHAAHIGWSWLIVIGTGLTFALGWLLGRSGSATGDENPVGPLDNRANVRQNV